MEKNVNRLLLALAALGLSTPAFAADCCSSKVLVPSQQGGFKVGIDALYLRANANDLTYATGVTFPSNFSLGLENNKSVDPSYDWGVYAQVGYLFPCTGNDLTLGYAYFNTHDTDSIVASNPGVTSAGIFINPLSQFSTPGIQRFFGAAESKSKYTLNVVDLETGQRFTTGSYDLRMFAGLRYANLDTTLETVGRPFPVGSGGQTTISGVQNFSSQFRGVGPRIGVDARYCLSSGFGLDADLSTSLLVGTIDSQYDASRDNTVITRAALVKDGSNSRVAPVLEAKLGGDYTYIMDRRCKSTLVLEAGYQVTNYFNVSDRPQVGTVAPRDTNDVAFDGPYLGVKYYA